jgi:hypothetical protein
MEESNLKHHDIYNTATSGQYGIVKLKTGQKSKRGVKFVNIQAGENNSSFLADLSGIGDKTFTWNLDKNQSILGPFSNIRNVVGELACYPTK